MKKLPLGALVKKLPLIKSLPIERLAKFKKWLMIKPAGDFLQYVGRFFFGNPWFTLVVIVPFIFTAVYFLLWASPRYESTTTILLKNNNSGEALSGVAALISGAESSGVANSYMLINYQSSWDMLDKLNQQLGIFKWYQSSQVDYFSRLSKSADQKDRLSYFQSMLGAEYDQNAQTVTFSAQGFTPSQAQQTMQKILVNLQQFMDHIEHQLTEKRLSYSHEQVQLARRKLQKAEAQILAYQNKQGILDPKKTLEAVASIMVQLQGQLVKEKTMLIDLQSYMQPNSAAIVAQKQKVEALQAQIIAQKKELLGSPNANQKKLNEMMAKFEWLRMSASFAVEAYKAAMQSYEMAKASLMKEQQQLVVLDPPTLPNYNAYPRIGYDLLTLLIVLLMTYGIGRMIITIIQEHRD